MLPQVMSWQLERCEMGYSQTTTIGNVYEILGGIGIEYLLDTAVDTNVDIGAGFFPSVADLLGGQVLGAYCDMCIPSATNAFAGSNWVKADAGYPTLRIVPNGHGAIDAISDLSLSAYCYAAGAYPFNWYPGDTNFASVFSPGSHYWGHAIKFNITNIRADQDTLRLNNFIFKFRFYVR